MLDPLRDSVVVDDATAGLDIVFGGNTATNKISLTDNLADALNINQGGASYMKFVTTDSSEQIVFGKNSTFNGTTIADLGTVTTATINGGNIDGTIIGANTAAAGSFAAIVGTSLNVSEGNITNVGSIACDSVVVDEATAGLDIVFGGNTATNKISLTDNLADALNINQGGASYMKFVTTDSSEQIVFGKNSTFNGTTIADLGTVTTATINGGNIDGTIIGANTAAAGSFAAIVGTSLNVSEGNITNVGSIACDSVVVDEATAGLDIVFGGNTATNKISLTDNLADALNINQGGASYMKFTTNNGSEQIVFGKGSTFSGTTIADLGTVTTATINGGNIDGTIIGANTAAAGSFAAIVGTSLSVSDGNITNVGSIACDSVVVDGATTGLDIVFGGNTATNKISLTDNLADALNINEGGNSYMKFTTTNSSEQIVFGKGSTFSGTTIADLGTVTTATINGGNIDGTIIGVNTAAAGSFAAIVGTSLSVSDGNITNVGSIACDSVVVDDAGTGLNIVFGGNTTTNKISLTDNIADALNINQGGNSYMKFVTTDGSEQIVFGKGSTFSGTTIADLGTVTTATINGGNIDNVTIGANTAAAGTFSSLNVSEGNITNVGSIACDSVVVDEATAGLDIVFGGNTTTNKISLTDNLADALNINQGGASYMKFVTTDSSEQIVFGKNSTFSGTTIANLGTVTTATINGGNIDGTIIGANTAAAGSFAAIVGTSLNVSEGNITNVGSIACDSVVVDEATAGLDIVFGGNTATNKISLTDNLADALNINQGGASYMKFTTTNGSEQIVFGKGSTFSGTTIADLGTVTTATINGGNIDGTIIGANTAAAGSFAAIVGTSLSVSDGNITNVASIACDSVVVDDAATGLDIQFGGNTTTNKISLTDNIADALNINEGGNSYMKFTTTTGGEQIVFGKNSTFSGTTIANLGTVTTATINGGNIDGTVIGAASAAAGSFAAIVGTSLSVSDGNITNVGSIACDSVVVDDASTGLDIVFGGNTTTNKISLTDNLADALNINEGGNSYMKFTTTNGSEQIVFGKNSTFSGTTIANLGTVTTATINGGNIDGTVIGATSAAAGTFAAIVGTSLSVSDGNITNVGSIACDSVVVDDASAGLDIVFGGNTTTNKISLTDNLADALNINEGGNSYMKFTTTNGSEQIVFGKNSTFSGTTIDNLGTVTTATINGGNIDGTVIGATSAVAGSFAAIVGTSLSVSDGNITNVASI